MKSSLLVLAVVVPSMLAASASAGPLDELKKGGDAVGKAAGAPFSGWNAYANSPEEVQRRTRPTSGAKAIEVKYSQLGGLGAPTGPVYASRVQGGMFQHFQRGSIYWQANTGAHEVHGSIYDKWASLGAENNPNLGYPTTDELTVPDRVGRLNHFQAGSIYWHPNTGAHVVRGAIRDKWASLGWERSQLGYPTSDTIANGAGTSAYQDFERGRITWNAGSQAVATVQ